jgi:hypothetical protein
MKNISFLLLFVCSISFAQNVNPDSLRTVESPLNFSTYFNPLRFLPDSYLDAELSSINLIIPQQNDSSSILMHTRMQLALFNTKDPFDAKSSLLNPLYNNYMDGQGNRLFKQILGAVQVGAVGILAYKHIEKYYIKKKK